jgi:hypothetical protein
MIPLLTLLQLSIGGDPSGNMGLRMLGERLKIQIVYRHANRWLEGDGTYAVSSAPTIAVATTELATPLVASASIYCECTFNLFGELNNSRDTHACTFSHRSALV